MEELQNKNHFCIGDVVISPQFGIGKIVDIEAVQGLDQQFYIIQDLEVHNKTMIPVKTANKKMRSLIGADTAKNLILKLSGPAIKKYEFDTKRERVEFFKKFQGCLEVESVVDAVMNLHSLHDKGKVEKQIFDNLLDNLTREFSYVMQMPPTDISNQINGNLSAAS